jgi:hypothetical protein
MEEAVMRNLEQDRFQADPKAELEEDPNVANDELSEDDLEQAAGGWTGDPGGG